MASSDTRAGAGVTREMPTRVQLRRTKGWKKPEGVIVVARPSKWGNPWIVGQHVTLSFAGRMDGPGAGRYDPGDCRYFDLSFDTRITAEQAVSLYRRDLLGNVTDGDACYDDLRAGLRSLRGHDLACWCALDQPCHADALLELAPMSESKLQRLADKRWEMP